MPHSNSTNTSIYTMPTWVMWVQQISATTGGGNQIFQSSSGATTGTLAWQSWVNQGSASITSAAGTWPLWVRSADASARIIQPSAVPAFVQERRIVSPEERAIHEAREAEWQAKLDIERAARAIAEAKAEILLRQLLTPEQVETLEKKNCFYLYSGDKKYRIDRGRTGNVKLVDAKDQVIESYCIHPSLACPDADTMLAQKLLIETDVETFERVANITARGPGGRTRNGRGLAVAAH